MLPKTKHNMLGKRINYRTQCLSCYICNSLRMYGGMYDSTIVRVGIGVKEKWKDFSRISLTRNRR